MVEINTRLRADPALQAAFGRSACAEQSVVQQTLDACTDENVTQMQEALDQIFRQHSRAYGHDYGGTYHILDVDMSGMPCGPKAALATKGYFAKCDLTMVLPSGLNHNLSSDWLLSLFESRQAA